MGGVDDEDREAREFWEHQRTLPLHKRDGLWWIEVALSNTVVWVVGVTVSFLAAGVLIALLR